MKTKTRVRNDRKQKRAAGQTLNAASHKAESPVPPSVAAALMALKNEINGSVALLRLTASELAIHLPLAGGVAADEIGDGLKALATDQIERTLNAWFTVAEAVSVAEGGAR